MARDIGHVERTNRGYICIRAKSGGIRSDFTQWGRGQPKIYLGRMQIGAGFVRFFLNVWKLHSSRCTCDLSGAPLSRQGREISATYKNGKPIFFLFRGDVAILVCCKAELFVDTRSAKEIICQTRARPSIGQFFCFHRIPFLCARFQFSLPIHRFRFTSFRFVCCVNPKNYP